MTILELLPIIKTTSTDVFLIAVILFLIVAMANFLYQIIKHSGTLIKNKLLGTEKVNDCSVDQDSCDINKHQFFARISNMEKYNVYKINFGGKTRNILFSDMLQIKLKIFREAIENFVKINVEDNQQWEEEFITLVSKAVNDYNEAWKNMKVPEKAINKFNEWHNQRVKQTTLTVQSIAHSSFYHSFKEKNIVMLDILTVLFNDTCEDMYLSAWALNGELTGIIYKGNPIEPLLKRHD